MYRAIIIGMQTSNNFHFGDSIGTIHLTLVCKTTTHLTWQGINIGNVQLLFTSIVLMHIVTVNPVTHDRLKK